MCGIEAVSPELTIKNRLGLHARAAATLVKEAGRFKSDIALVKDGQVADAKSVLSLISLGCPYSCRVRVRAEGDDAAEAISAVAAVIESRFGEE